MRSTFGSLLRGGGGERQATRQQKAQERDLLAALQQVLSRFGTGEENEPPPPPQTTGDQRAPPNRAARRREQRRGQQQGLLGSLTRLVNRASKKDESELLPQLARLVAAASNGNLDRGNTDGKRSQPKGGYAPAVAFFKDYMEKEEWNNRSKNVKRAAFNATSGWCRHIPRRSSKHPAWTEY